MDIEKLKDEAAIFLEEMHVSGDAMIDMDHCLDELAVDEHGSYYLHDVLAGFLLYFEKKQEIEQSLEPVSVETLVTLPAIAQNLRYRYK